ncbi:hypothetical protein D3C72_1886320 [compost metagenome]
MATMATAGITPGAGTHGDHTLTTTVTVGVAADTTAVAGVAAIMVAAYIPIEITDQDQEVMTVVYQDMAAAPETAADLADQV